MPGGRGPRASDRKTAPDGTDPAASSETQVARDAFGQALPARVFPELDVPGRDPEALAGILDSAIEDLVHRTRHVAGPVGLSAVDVTKAVFFRNRESAGMLKIPLVRSNHGETRSRHASSHSL